MRRSRKQVVALALEGSIYVLGGNDSQFYSKLEDKCRLTLVERYDPGSNNWYTMDPLTKGRDAFAGCVLDGCVYVVGGIDNSSRPITSCERYDPLTEKWSPVASLSTARAGARVLVFGQSIFLFGGHDGENALNIVEVYDPLRDSWRLVQPIKYRGYLCGVGVIPAEKEPRRF